MAIDHIKAPASLAAGTFEALGSPENPHGGQRVTLFKHGGFLAADESVETGTWQATPGQFRRAVMDAEFSHFISGRATFTADDGQVVEFSAGDAAYFPPFTRGVWTIHETLRKTFVVWKASAGA